MAWVSLDVAGPFLVVAHGIYREADHLGVALLEFGFSLATSPNSVVQTGVKSLGCETNPQLLPR